jgi:MATE family multidrug resistance protein
MQHHMKRQNGSTLRRLLTIALPMVVSQASDTIMMFVDRLFLSRLGEQYLAAAMGGGLTSFMTSSFFIGTVSYVTAIVAQYYGARRHERCAEATFQAALLALMCYPLLLGIAPLVRYLFVAAGQSPEQIRLGYTYFRILIFGGVFLVLRFALAGFFLGIGRTTVVMLANVAGMLVNVPANYVLIFGKLGFPALGLQGAAIGTVFGNATIFALLLLFYLRGANRRRFNTHKSLIFRPQIMGRLLRFGVPAGFEMFLSTAAFNLFVQFMYSYGTDVAAAVTITFNWDIVAFIPMLGMSHATTALVGQNIGASDYGEARHSAYVALRVAWIYSFSMVLLFVFGTRYLVGAFTPGLGGGAEQIVALATVMLRLAALYTLADSAQLVFTGALRAAGDTRWVMRMSIGLHWAFSAVAILLIRVVRADPVAVWLLFIGFVIGLGLVMYLRFRSGKWERIELIQREVRQARASG